MRTWPIIVLSTLWLLGCERGGGASSTSATNALAPATSKAAPSVAPPAAAAQPTTVIVPATVAWQGVVLKTAGWTPAASSAEIYIFTKGSVIRHAGANPLVWLRTEWPTLQRRGWPPFRTIVELAEVNCGKGLWRDRALTEYEQNNSQGFGVSTDIDATYGQCPKCSIPWQDASDYGSEAQYELTRATLEKLACAPS